MWRIAPPHAGDGDDQADTDPGGRRVRSTKRRMDVPDLPRRRVDPRTVGRVYTAPDGAQHQPSMWLTLTLDSYGPVHAVRKASSGKPIPCACKRMHADDDPALGTPVDPATYDYRRAAWDAVHFPRLLDRFWQNLRRAEDSNVQYAGCVEPQRRLAPHAHFPFRTKREASAFLAEVETALNRGTYVAPDAGRLRFGDYGQRWLAGRNDEKATAARDLSVMRNHVLPRWGKVPLAKIEHSAVQSWVTELGERLSPATIRECYRLMSGVMRSAVRDRLIGFNPCEGVRLPRRRRKDTDDQTITRDELMASLLPAAPHRYRALIALAAGTGLRWGECVGLRWDAVDLAAGVVRVVRVAEEISGHVRLKPHPKSRAGRRSVPLPPFVVEALTEHARDYGPGEDNLIFVARTGAALKRGTFRARIWKPSLQRAGLPMELRFHDLRHSYATWLVSDGVPINDVAKVIGHEQTSTTLDRYTHSTQDRDSRVLRSFAAISLPPAAGDAPE